LFACAGRVYIRYKCFHKLLIDDWAMIFALVLLLCSVSLGQVYLKDIYMLMGVARGDIIPDANFPHEAQRGLRAFGIAMLFSYLGIWAIKLNFLLFFKRLGAQITAYTIFWWIVLVFTMACGVVSIGLMQFHCMFGPITEIMVVCPQYDILKKTYDFFKVSCIVDVISDAFSESTNSPQTARAQTHESYSHLLPSCHSVEDLHQPKEEAYAVRYLRPRGFHHGDNDCERKYLWWCLQNHRPKPQTGHERHMDLVLVLY
jgi:hypothetical protein